MTTNDLDAHARELIAKAGARSVYLGYHPSFGAMPYPGVLCISVDDAGTVYVTGLSRIDRRRSFVTVAYGRDGTRLWMDEAEAWTPEIPRPGAPRGPAIAAHPDGGAAISGRRPAKVPTSEHRSNPCMAQDGIRYARGLLEHDPRLHGHGRIRQVPH